MLDLKNKSILVTGGTGSFGNQFISMMLKRFPDMERLIVFSRDEFKQYEMAQKFPKDQYPQLHFFIGDIRDQNRVKEVLHGVDIVIHAAALKQVPTAEFNPMEFIKTNVQGAENLIAASIEKNVKQIISLSSDKASSPVSVYGASKLCADKVFLAADLQSNYTGLRTSVVRYGNIFGSRGSVLPQFLEMANQGEIQITHAEMTRFHTARGKETELVLHALNNSWGGEIFVPKQPSFRVVDLAEAISPTVPKIISGIRPGEKIHEEMVSIADSHKTIDLGDKYVILPLKSEKEIEKYISNYGGKLLEHGFSYSSDINNNWLTVEELNEEVIRYIQPNTQKVK